MNTDSVTASTLVAVDPTTAFTIFTTEIGGWWKPKVRGMFQRDRDGTLHFDSGRLLEVYGEGEPFEIGRVLAWDPGRRLVVEWRQQGCAPTEVTEVEVRFEAAPRGTRVTIEHRGWDRLPAGHPARHGFTGTAFTSMIGLRWGDALTGFRSAASRLQ